MIRHLLPSALLTLAITILCGLAYPLAVTGLADKLFPAQAHGSLIARNGVTLGSAVVGQNFTLPQYIHPRPSATTQPDPQDAAKTVAAPYNAASSAASNLALSSKAYAEGVAALTAQVQAENPKAQGPVPMELVTASASGLDPDLSPEAAKYQAARVAAARRAPIRDVETLIDAYTKSRLLGIFGMPTVNVLELNLALDARWPSIN
jgi:K+-transporting ATPase ATPase C chain